MQSIIADATHWELAPDEEKTGYHAAGVYVELYEQLAGRRDAWLSELERRFTAASVDAEEREKKRRKDEQDERERLLVERKAEVEQMAQMEREREATAESLVENERMSAAEQTAAARRYLQFGMIAATFAVLALIFGGIAGWYWDRSVKAQQLTAMQLLAIQARRAATEATTLNVIERAAALALESIALARKGNRPSAADAVETTRTTLIRLPLLALTHGSSVTALAGLEDGRLASGGQDGTVKLWPRDGVGEPAVLTHGHGVQFLAVLSDGRLASGGGSRIKLWPKDGLGEPVVLTHGSSVQSVAVLGDRRLASVDDDGRIKLWPEDGVGEPVVLSTGSPVWPLVVLRDGRLTSGDL